MRIFISHASKNSEIVIKFAEFLERISSDIEVFCSSEKNSIQIGKNFIDTIFDELNKSDLFIPIISREYYESKFCMIELGVAYSYLFNQTKHSEGYIFPFTLYPVLKGDALSGTPLANIQTGSINDKADLHGFLDYLVSDKGIVIGGGLNQKLHSFHFELEQIILKNQNIIESAKIGTYFDENNIDFKDREDIVSASVADNMIILNYNMNPYEYKIINYPKFISVALQYVDNLDLYRYLNFTNQAEFTFVLTNFTNSLKRIYVEFKYADNRILETFKFPIQNGENKLHIPLEKMRSKALSNISQICFVIHPEDVTEIEGMFKIGGILIK